MEDRFSAIRAAIGTAAPGDVVVIAGRGHVDFMEYWDGEVRCCCILWDIEALFLLPHLSQVFGILNNANESTFLCNIVRRMALLEVG
jgi:hypothetical protein